MTDLGGERISDGSLFFNRTMMPILWGGLCLAWFVIVIAVGAWPAVLLGVPLAISGFARLIRLHLPLREVTLGERGLTLTSCRSSIVVPYEAIATIKQDPRRDAAIVEVVLDRDTLAGRRFTFLPRRPNMGHFPFTREDRVVTLLRERVARTRADGGKPLVAPGSVGRSPMADDELDGPFGPSQAM